MSIQVRAAEIHADAQLTPPQLLARAHEIAVSADVTPLIIVRLGDASRNLDVHVPTLEQIGQTTTALKTAARAITNVAAFARSVAAKLSTGVTLLDALNDPASLTGLVSGLLPGTNAKQLQLALALAHDVLDFTLNPGAKTGLSLIKDLSGAAGQLARKNPFASSTDALLSGVASVLSGQDLQLDRFLSGSLVALAKDLSAQAGVLKEDAGGDL